MKEGDDLYFITSTVVLGISACIVLYIVIMFLDDENVYKLPTVITRLLNKELADLIDLHNEYISASFISPQKITVRVKSAAAFKAFDKTTFLQNNMELFEFDSIANKYSSEQYKKYLVKLSLFKNSSSRRVRKLSVNPDTKAVVVNYSYISPKGRNHYADDAIYGYDELIELIRIISEQQRKLNENKTFAEIERSKMGAKLRYEVIKRDGGKCVVCGRSAADGVKLHVDHIIPVSKGGKTELDNLRTLCQDCNLGKSDKYDEDYQYIKH